MGTQRQCQLGRRWRNQLDSSQLEQQVHCTEAGRQHRQSRPVVVPRSCSIEAGRQHRQNRPVVVPRSCSTEAGRLRIPSRLEQVRRCCTAAARRRTQSTQPGRSCTEAVRPHIRSIDKRPTRLEAVVRNWRPVVRNWRPVVHNWRQVQSCSRPAR